MACSSLRLYLLASISFIWSLSAAWRLEHRYDGTNWNKMMDTENITPNNEFARFLNAQDAQHRGLIRTMPNRGFYVGVDSQNITSPNGPGRDSIRLKSKAQYGPGRLFIGDFKHLPEQTCGSWPSFFLVGPNWPGDGEIDVIEGVDALRNNQMTIHSGPGCLPKIGPEGQGGVKTGTNNDCGVGIGDVGCAVTHPSESGMGKGFNAVGGGVYAVLWENNQIRIWNWVRYAVPYDIQRDRPNPSNWGRPVANWQGCAFGNFKNLQIVLLTAFCGNWAGGDGTWKDPKYGACSNQAPTCRQFVAQNPNAFRESYWSINSIKTYTN